MPAIQPIRSTTTSVRSYDSAERAAMVGFIPNQFAASNSLGFSAVPFAVGAGATITSNPLMVMGYTRFNIAVTAAVTMDLVIRTLNPTNDAQLYTETIAGAFVAATLTLVAFGDGTANLTGRVFHTITIGIRNPSGGSANVTALSGLLCSAS